MNISNITLYVTSKCNLSCEYCYIKKDYKFLNEQDEIIVENYSQLLSQVLNFNKDIKYTVQSLTFWGGEPFLYFDRIINILPEWIKTFPYLKTFIFSTNFTLDNSIEKIKNFIQILEQYPKRKFNIQMQLSIDGPSFINDKNRGFGSTQWFIQNWNKIKEINYNINFIFKPTLLKEDLYLLNQNNNLNQYFKFFEQFGYNGAWTFAVPQNWTKEDGKFYTRFLSELKRNHKIIPESNLKCSYNCTSILHNLTPIGNDKYCLCHRGYFDDINSIYIYTKKELLNLQNILKQSYKNQSLIKENFIKEIQFAALNKQIDQKYLDRKNIIPTLKILMTKNCPYNNYIYNGNFLYPLINEIPLYYNGAIDIILKG